MVRAVLFDMGGTLDGGAHWLDRFARLYADAGLAVSRDEVRTAFDHAERLAVTDDWIASAHLDEMIERHVGWQIDRLASPSNGLSERRANMSSQVASAFVRSVRDAAPDNVRLLAGLAAEGFQLGVVSNGCGNVDVLCEDLGYRPFLSLVVDSRRLGIAKPDSRIYTYACRALGLLPASVAMVGDSLERDIRPAKSIGMAAAWLSGPNAAPAADAGGADLVLQSLDELRAALRTLSRTVA
jgi:putative hydrolase of the HAD superfamily